MLWSARKNRTTKKKSSVEKDLRKSPKKGGALKRMEPYRMLKIKHNRTTKNSWVKNV